MANNNRTRLVLMPVTPGISQERLIEIVQYNFDQIILHGGGDKGDKGETGMGIPGASGVSIKGDKGDTGNSIRITSSTVSNGDTDDDWNEGDIIVDGNGSMYDITSDGSAQFAFNLLYETSGFLSDQWVYNQSSGVGSMWEMVDESGDIGKSNVVFALKDGTDNTLYSLSIGSTETNSTNHSLSLTNIHKVDDTETTQLILGYRDSKTSQLDINKVSFNYTKLNGSYEYTNSLLGSSISIKGVDSASSIIELQSNGLVIEYNGGESVSIIGTNVSATSQLSFEAPSLKLDSDRIVIKDDSVISSDNIVLDTSIDAIGARININSRLNRTYTDVSINSTDDFSGGSVSVLNRYNIINLTTVHTHKPYSGLESGSSGLVWNVNSTDLAVGDTVIIKAASKFCVLGKSYFTNEMGAYGGVSSPSNTNIVITDKDFVALSIGDEVTLEYDGTDFTLVNVISSGYVDLDASVIAYDLDNLAQEGKYKLVSDISTQSSIPSQQVLSLGGIDSFVVPVAKYANYTSNQPSYYTTSTSDILIDVDKNGNKFIQTIRISNEIWTRVMGDTDWRCISGNKWRHYSDPSPYSNLSLAGVTLNLANTHPVKNSCKYLIGENSLTLSISMIIDDATNYTTSGLSEIYIPLPNSMSFVNSTDMYGVGFIGWTDSSSVDHRYPCCIKAVGSNAIFKLWDDSLDIATGFSQLIVRGQIQLPVVPDYTSPTDDVILH